MAVEPSFRDFSSDSRFAKERLWHVEVSFGEPTAGMIVIGDGRFLGFGIMAPVADPRKQISLSPTMGSR